MKIFSRHCDKYLQVRRRISRFPNIYESPETKGSQVINHKPVTATLQAPTRLSLSPQTHIKRQMQRSS